MLNGVSNTWEDLDVRGKRRVLLIRPTYASAFIESDRELLERHYDVRVVAFIVGKRKLMRTIETIFKVIMGVAWADIVFIWFASNHAYWSIKFSKIFQKKVIAIVGGGEVAYVPEIGYGLLLDKKQAKKVRYVLRGADNILAVSEFNKAEILKCEERAAPITVYNGVDINEFTPGNREKENLVLTVGFVTSNTIDRKGFKTYVKCAERIPESLFVLIGRCEDGSVDLLKAIAPPNMKFLDFLPGEDLLEWYQRARVYCQLSLYESFGVALAEAMSCECIPVVTPNGALPEVVGNTGFYVPYGNPEATAIAIRTALNSDRGKDARDRIGNLFALDKREKKIIETIEEMLKDK
ncbi:MAG: glycosyltransferase family 4 protein [Candidatus Thorarchaeota archaeon]